MRTPAQADQAYADNNGDENVIPKGMYCYTRGEIRMGENGLPVMSTTSCPYWAVDPGKPEQGNGYCALLQAKNADGGDDGLSLLWDQVKECGVNNAIDDDDDTTIDEITPWEEALNANKD